MTQEHESQGEATERVTIPVLGLSCAGGGALAVERSLLRVNGVQNAYVNPATEMAYITYDPVLCSASGLQEAIRRVGLRPGAPIYRLRPSLW